MVKENMRKKKKYSTSGLVDVCEPLSRSARDIVVLMLVYNSTTARMFVISPSSVYY